MMLQKRTRTVTRKWLVGLSRFSGTAALRKHLILQSPAVRRARSASSKEGDISLSVVA